MTFSVLFFISKSIERIKSWIPWTSTLRCAIKGEERAGLWTRHCHWAARSWRVSVTWSRLIPITAPLSSRVAIISPVWPASEIKFVYKKNLVLPLRWDWLIPSRLRFPALHHSIRGTGRPPPDRHSKVTVVPSLKGPIRDTFLIAAEVLPSSSRISTYSGAAVLPSKI